MSRAVIRRYRDNNVSVFSDLILCPKLLFTCLMAVIFSGGGEAQGPNPFMYYF